MHYFEDVKKNENSVAISGQHECPDVLSYFESSINLADNWLNFILENDPGYVLVCTICFLESFTHRYTERSTVPIRVRWQREAWATSRFFHLDDALPDIYSAFEASLRIPGPSASNRSFSVSKPGPLLMRTIGPLRLAHSHSRHA
ncbi:hypothetical protein Pyn_39382 [Prunus yedoensis var. nudiflora]|uniref:Uncharacterized protein n=1 Tax=Prunus yedoensis var. nudiflora TaxID=2094558 RepID=A0A314Z2A3_PRUYE|nr:hypothetical protein Pyn_39382 [Prunus yedoensis var. nudiflora]